MTCLLEVPKHIAFLYMKPECLELCVPSRDKSECINYCKKHKVTQTKKKPEHSTIWLFLENEHSSKTVILFANTSKICVRAFEQRLNFASISKIRGTIATPEESVHYSPQSQNV